jgi:hypothetical protein
MIDDSAEDPLGSKYDPLADCPDLLAALGWTPRHSVPDARRPSWFQRYVARFAERRTVIDLPPRPSNPSRPARNTAPTSRLLHPATIAR